MKASPPANDNAKAKAKAKAAPACPVCGRPRVEKYSPFCSRRCADVDLYRWLNGKYAIPGNEASERDEDVGREDE